MKRIAFSSKTLLVSLILACGLLVVSCSSSQGDEENLEVAVEETGENTAEGQEAYADNQIALAGGDNELANNENLTVGVDPGGDNQEIMENDTGAELPTEGNMAQADAAGNNIANIASGGDESNVLAEAAADTELIANQSNEAIESVIDEGDATVPIDNQLATNDPMASNEIANTAGDLPADDTAPDAALPMDAGGDMAAMPATITEGSALPEMGAKLAYVVKKGDTLGDIAQNIYGDKSRWRDLARWSGFSNPHLIFPGNLVYYQYTEQSAAFAQKYESQPKAEVVVQAGDSLSGIAARVYGDHSHWVIIWRHNGHVTNPDRIEVGQVITYPQQGYLSVARQADDHDEVVNRSNTPAAAVGATVETTTQDEPQTEQATKQKVSQQIKQALPSTTPADREAV